MLIGGIYYLYFADLYGLSGGWAGDFLGMSGTILPLVLASILPVYRETGADGVLLESLLPD